jgi:predicted esterase
MKTFTRKVLLFSLSFLLLHTLQAQKMLDPTDTLVNYDSTHPPVQPPFGKIGKWVRTPSMDWNSIAYKAYIYKGSDFRLHFPQTYKPNDGKKYPILVFYHGNGEIGPIYDNETTLRNGGLIFHKMEVGGVFDGYIIIMQNQFGWGTVQFNNLQNLIDTLVQEYGGDPYRVIQNGLSGGGQGTWEQLALNPTYFAAAIPMSAALPEEATSTNVNTLKFTPIWNLDGGLDSNPAPFTAQQVANAYLSKGANYVYTNFPNLGHGTWDTTWALPTFWPYVNSAYLSNPWPLFNNTIFCPGHPIKVTMGIVPGLDGYQWRKNDTLIAGATTDSIVVTQPGTYDARVLRGSAWSDWSHVPVTIASGLPPLTFTVTQPTCTNAKGSIIITAPARDTLLYSLDGGSFTSNGVFDSLAPGIYHITVQGSKCGGALFTDTIKPQPITPGRPNLTIVQPSCAQAKGSFTINVSDTSYLWSINNGHNYGKQTKFTNLPQGEYLVTAQAPGGCVSLKDTVFITASVNVPPTPSVTVTQPTCTVPTGTITINTSPADTGLTYSINGSNYQTVTSFPKLAGGRYPVTSKNSVCPSLADTVTISTAKVIPSPPSLTLLQPTCTVATGQITVTSPLDTTLGYSINGSNYQRAPQFATVSPGNYNVTVKSSQGCVSSATAAAIHTQPKPPGAPGVTVVQPTCTTGGGTIRITGADTVDLSYSINGSTYLAQSNFSNVTSGTYHVTAETAAGCVSSAVTAVVNPIEGAPATPTVVITQPSCTVDVGQITITSPIASGYTYRVQDTAGFQPVPLFNNLAPGTYYVAVKTGDGGCVSQPATAVIRPSPALAKPVVTVTQATCRINAGAITVTSPVDTGLLYSINGIIYSPDSVISPVSPGTYQVTVKDGAGCVSAPAPAQVLNPPSNCSGCAADGHSSFDGFLASANPGYPTTVWFNLHTKLQADQLTANGDYLLFTGGNIVLAGIGASFDSSVALPDGEIIADNSTNSPTTTYIPAKNLWITRVPVGYESADIFVSGAAINSGTGFSLSGPTHATLLSGSWSSNKNISSQWWYGLASYQPIFDNTSVGSVNATDGSPTGGHIAGTPNDQSGGLVSGGSGNGGSNYTGNFSTADNFTACLVAQAVPTNVELKVYPNPYQNTVYFNINSSISGTGTLEFYNLVGERLSTTDNLQFQAGVTQTITVPMLTVAQRQAVVYIFRIGSKRIQGTLLPLK